VTEERTHVVSHALHLLAEALLGVAALVALAGCVLAWRLAQGPIDVTGLAHRLQGMIAGAGAHVTVQQARLEWEGFHDPDSPLQVSWTNAEITDAGGRLLAHLPSGRVSFSAAKLLLGRVVPRTVVVEAPQISLHRGRDGLLALDIGTAAPAPPGQGGAALIRDLVQRPSASAGGLEFLAQLQTVRVHHANVTMRNDALGLTWQATDADIALQRGQGGAIEGSARVPLRLGAVTATLTAKASLSEGGTSVEASLTAVNPSALATSVPGLLPAAAVDMPVSARVTVALDQSMMPRHFSAHVETQPGILHAGRGQVALNTATIDLDGTPEHVAARSVRVTFQPPPDAHAPPPVLMAHATIDRAGDKLHIGFGVAVDRMSFADLGVYWPVGTGGGSRGWLVRNITGGLAENAHAEGVLDTDTAFSDANLTALAGGATGSDLTLHWLRPIPPIEKGEAHLTLDGPNDMHIDVPHAEQGPLRMSDGSVKITGIMAKDQFGRITARIRGPLAGALTLLNHPRLALLSRQPIPINDPAGTADTRLTVTLPLDVHVTFDQIGISAAAHLADVHLGKVALNRDLDGGDLDLKVDTDALAIGGTGRFAGIPATLKLGMDFRSGPPSQVVDTVSAVGEAGGDLLRSFGLPQGYVTGGAARVSVDYSDRRDGVGAVALNADLTGASVASPIGWSKAAGDHAFASARLVLDHDHLVGIDSVTASGPGLSVATHADLVGGVPRVLHLDTVKVGRTDVRGTISLPHQGDQATRVMLRGAALDISEALKARNQSQSTDDTARGPAWNADIDVGRVILAKDEALAPVTLRANNDGLRITTLLLSAGADPGVHATIRPAPGGRKLTVESADAGAVLLAAGIADNIRGGHLHVDGDYDDSIASSPLTGLATLGQFRITNAPAMALLLKAMTLYGAFDLLRGQGLGVQRALVPFRWQSGVMHMTSARAYSASLGLTAAGDVDLRHRTADVTGTIVPAYFFNQLLGKIPLVGGLFSPEKGGGLFAARYSVRGKLADPVVKLNPLSALTPGALRELFGK
jgi:hypothetical protein